MSQSLRITAMARAAALSVALLVPAASGAFAQQSTLEQIYQPGVNNAFGAQSEKQILRAARAAPAAPALTAEQRRVLEKEFKTGQNDAFGAASAPQPSQLIQEYSHTASTVPIVGGKRDLVGDGGHQDELAREIYRPGSPLPGQ
jgi:hypothetical protein